MLVKNTVLQLVDMRYLKNMDIQYDIALAHSPGIGPKRWQRLLHYFGSAQGVYSADRQEWRALGLPLSLRENLISPASVTVQTALAWQASSNEHHIITPNCVDYPVLLQHITFPPPCLYVRGNPSCLQRPCLAMVGSRRAASDVTAFTMRLACECAERGVVIVSGLARGVDAAAHRGALLLPAATVAVIATGIDQTYPAEHRILADEIVSQGGAIVTEYALGTSPKAAHFPQRNRIISGLAVGTLVAAAALRSGSLITARYAMEQNREVLALPGSVRSAVSAGCHALIKDGAALVTSVDDIFTAVPQLLSAQNESIEESV